MTTEIRDLICRMAPATCSGAALVDEKRKAGSQPESISLKPRPLRDLIERRFDSIGLSAQNPARSTDISAARILGLNHRLFET